MQKVLLAVALGLGLAIAFVDTRPGWDDTGVTVLAIVVGCAGLGMAGPERPWLWALALGIWIPVVNILTTWNYGSMLAIPFAFAGAYLGMGVRCAVVAA